MDDFFCVSWPDNDCLFLPDSRHNDLGHTGARSHLLGLRSTSLSGWVQGVSSNDPITSVSLSSSSPLPWWLQHQRSYSSSATCDVQTSERQRGREREREDIEWPWAHSFYPPSWNFSFTQAGITQSVVSNFWFVFDGECCASYYDKVIKLIYIFTF